MKIAFALGGGGARGLAHVGVIRALTEAEIKPDLIVGASMGSIVGAMYAQTADIDAVEYKLREYTKTEHFQKMNLSNYNPQQKTRSFLDDAIKRIEERIVINLTVSEIALFKQKKFITALEYLLEEGRIEETKIKYAAVAGDLITGKKVIIDKGDIRLAALASSSIPAFLPPVEIEGKTLVDGEVVELIPCQSAKELGAEFVIGVDVRQGLPPNPEIENALDVFFRASMIRSNNLADYVLKADVAIQPKVKNIHWTEFDKLDELIKAGYTAGKEKVETIKKALSKRRFRFWKRYN